MKKLAITMMVLALAASVDPALSQSLNARRMGMGGVVLPFGGSASDANVAYRAVPAEAQAATSKPSAKNKRVAGLASGVIATRAP